MYTQVDCYYLIINAYKTLYCAHGKAGHGKTYLLSKGYKTDAMHP